MSAPTPDNNRYRSTLNLPSTTFSMRANAQAMEPLLIARWQEVYTQSCQGSNPLFVLHDGPPYANGHIHLGHAVNKVLKDIVCKTRRMSGYRALFKPGWDCHGLPIELKVSAEGITKDSPEFLARCRSTAQHWIDVQRQEFKRLGVLADWDNAYTTMDASYEADIVRAFANMVEAGYIERHYKTIPWCMSCKTALATAEIEYAERKDPSLYVLFPLMETDAAVLCGPLFKQHGVRAISLLVWTTTPWTLPLNRAVAINPDATYVVLEHPGLASWFVVAHDRADAICALMGIERHEIGKLAAASLAGKEVMHPFEEGRAVPIITSDTVLLSDGTACMHVAPGCGPDDYLLGLGEGLEIYSPVSPEGTYTSEVKPASLAGMTITDAQIAVIRSLAERGLLAHKTSLRHAYPHCWRCHNGLIFRATKQWFCNLTHRALLERAERAAADVITFVPAAGRARFLATIASRQEWCLSRQRRWGVPIIALRCTSCDEAWCPVSCMRAVADIIATQGLEFWYDASVTELIVRGCIQPEALVCSRCCAVGPDYFVLSSDIVDVWFESGVSHWAVLKPAHQVPADVYLEGSDQHRAWFQSSLLTALALGDTPPMREIITHGYVVDEHGRKMSKSLGNVVSPQEVIDQYGADVLRLWAASVDYRGDMVVSKTVLASVAEVYRKIRNTARFLLANLYDFDSTQHSIRFDELMLVDQQAVASAYTFAEKVREAYTNYDFPHVYQLFGSYCASDLSACFLDIMKDRLYVEKADGLLRRSAQTACWHILDVLTRSIAPILSFLAEEIADAYQPAGHPSIHAQQFSPVRDVWTELGVDAAVMSERWRALMAVRDVVLKAIEAQRAAGIIHHSLEAALIMHIDQQSIEGTALASIDPQLIKELCIVSHVEMVDASVVLDATAVPGVRLLVARARGRKCPRCWQWDASGHPDDLCARCASILG